MIPTLKNLFLNGKTMKNTLIGLILGLIIAMWAFYIYTQRSIPIKISEELASPTTAASTIPTVVSDETLIKQAFAQKYQKPITDVQLTVKQNTGTLAQGGVSFTGEIAGAWWLAAKMGNQWKIVQDGNGTISCETIAPYKFPLSMVSECVDKNGKLVKF